MLCRRRLESCFVPPQAGTAGYYQYQGVGLLVRTDNSIRVDLIMTKLQLGRRSTTNRCQPDITAPFSQGATSYTPRTSFRLAAAVLRQTATADRHVNR